MAKARAYYPVTIYGLTLLCALGLASVVADAAMTERIRGIHCDSDGSYGSRRVHAQLRREGVAVNKKRVERSMRVGEIVGAHVPSRRRRSTAEGLLGVEGVKAWPDLVGRDCQYTAVTFAKGLTASGIVASFSAKGTPHDNAAKESFFATLEKEHLRTRSFESHAQARSSIFRYIEGWYNPRRLHSTLGYRSPDEAERDYHDQRSAPAVTTVSTERVA